MQVLLSQLFFCYKIFLKNSCLGQNCGAELQLSKALFVPDTVKTVFAILNVTLYNFWLVGN